MTCCVPGELKLVQGVENYEFLNKSGCVDVAARDDVGDFQAVQVSATGSLGIPTATSLTNGNFFFFIARIQRINIERQFF